MAGMREISDKNNNIRKSPKLINNPQRKFKGFKFNNPSIMKKSESSIEKEHYEPAKISDVALDNGGMVRTCHENLLEHSRLFSNHSLHKTIYRALSYVLTLLVIAGLIAVIVVLLLKYFFK